MVKSPPELWAELSELEGLERHLGEFGEIRITRAEPETTVAWEGANASGIVELEPMGWGTKVTITAEVVGAEPAPEPGADEAPARVDDAPRDEQPPVAAVEPDHPVAGPEAGSTHPAAEIHEPEAAEPAADEPQLGEPETTEPTAKRNGFFARWLFRQRRGREPATQALALRDFPERPSPHEPPTVEADATRPMRRAEPPPETDSAFDPEADVDPWAEPDVWVERVTSQTDAEPEPIRVPPPDGELEFEFDFQLRRGDEPSEAPEQEPDPVAPERAQEILETALENLGQAHHRPFSRS